MACYLYTMVGSIWFTPYFSTGLEFMRTMARKKNHCSVAGGMSTLDRGTMRRPAGAGGFPPKENQQFGGQTRHDRPN